MANGDSSVDLQQEVTKRKAWFFECQLRRLTVDSFRGVSEAVADPLIDLISETLFTVGFPAGQIGRMRSLGRVYLDSQQPVWTPDERTRRDTFSQTLTGRLCNWLEFREPYRLAEAVGEVRKTVEASRFASLFDLPPEVNRFWRKPAHDDPRWQEMDAGEIGPAISRASIADAKPWLIPELYRSKHQDPVPAVNWIENLEQFILDVESELQVTVGGVAGNRLPFEPLSLSAYRSLIRFMLEASTTRDTGDAVRVSLVEKKPTADGKDFKYEHNLRVQTNGFPMGNAADYPFSFKTRYWTRVVRGSLGEVYVNKDNSDMGLCLLIRLLYLYGPLPSTMAAGQDLPWRKRTPPDATFDAFFAARGDDAAIKDDPALRERLTAAQARLRVLLEESAAVPRSAAITYSPIVQEILRQGIRRYKFWLDEPMRAKEFGALNKARADIGIGSADREMEYWSENHYIMFASSEYLAGQLWEDDEFQPAKDFLDPTSKMGVLKGTDRRDRGKARVLKWLNNRLMFGWTEFNSSGYYREHLWALLNLVDFALDAEVRDKAAIATDLLLFDVLRFAHGGASGAAGGRCQFKSKVSGWDNALGDVVEILSGTRGLFFESNALIAASLASSTYKAPDVLLAIAATPPDAGYVDRSRVSITFEEAPKYGIWYSKQSDAVDSLRAGYAPKLRRHFPFIDAVNREIERTHPGMTAADDDIVFWWSTSAFYNKQVVRGTFACREKFTLDTTGVFKGIVPTLIKTIIPLLKRASSSLFGGLFGGLFGLGGFGLIGGAISPEALGTELEESTSDDLSLFLEGSTRTRANILTYRSRDAMLSSLQNFRVGQLNFQSSVNQATLNGAVSVFPTAGFAGLDISDLNVAAAGGLAGVAVGVGAVGGAVAAVAVNEAAIHGSNPFADDEADGPAWWTGYWALPMVVQHRSAAIIVSDFHDVQEFLAEAGSHVWFPKAGFDKVDEVRSSAYDDDNFFLLDITNIGPKGFWLFGKIVHKGGDGPVADRPEAYVGVFSNQRPEWLDRENGAEMYDEKFEEEVEDKIEELEDSIDDKLDDLEDQEVADGVEIGYVGRQTIEVVVSRALNATYRENINRDEWIQKAKAEVAQAKSAMVQRFLGKIQELIDPSVDLRNLQRVWKEPLPRDYFADHDWYVDEKNIWIVQVGSKAEFGSYERFKERVSGAKVTIDDSGDMECTYHMPLPDGTSEELSVKYEDGGEFRVNGAPFQTDLYPRFENPFIRGQRVEWGQRDYVLEYKGKTLLHDFSDFTKPIRREAIEVTPEEANLVKALVIFQKTGDEEMEELTIGTATVQIGCATATSDQVIAVGPIEEETDHDAEWLFFDRPIPCSPDLTLSLAHRAIGDGDDEAEWKMSFSLKALMGDHSLKECALSFSAVSFEENRRSVGPMPFTIVASKWRAWQTVGESRKPVRWMIADRPAWNTVYYDYCDLFALDRERRFWHRRLDPCLSGSPWSALPREGEGPSFAHAFSAQAISVWPKNLLFFAASQGALFVTWLDASGKWMAWTRIEPFVYPVSIFGIPDTTAAPIPVTLAADTAVFASLSTQSLDGVELYVVGADGHLYGHLDWRPWMAGAWRKIEISGFAVRPGSDVQVTRDRLFVLATSGALWSAPANRSILELSPSWEMVSLPGQWIRRFAVATEADTTHVLATTADGSAWAAIIPTGGTVAWTPLGQPGGSPVPTDVRLAWAFPFPGRLDLFAVASDGVVYTVTWEHARGWGAWTPPVERGQGFTAAGQSPVVVHRVNRQVELFAQSSDGDLFRAWWS